MTLHLGTFSTACGCESGGTLPSPDAALAQALALCSPVPGIDTLPLADAVGRVTARATMAPRPLPRFDNAAMDGYAVATGDLTNKGPWLIPVVSQIPAGVDGPPLAPGTAARIMTGAPVPVGADAVIAQEDVARQGNGILVKSRPEPGTHIRHRGEDIAVGGEILPPGRILGAKELAALGAAGLETIAVRRRVRVAVLVTGAELGSDNQLAMIGDANTPLLTAALSLPWVTMLPPLVLPDDPGIIADAFGALARCADLIVTTGGLSVGDEDHLRHAVKKAGGRVSLSGVAMKPGKPLSFGRAGGAFWLGLSGNPVAALTGWTGFGRPVAAALAGLAGSPLTRIMARLAEPVSHGSGRCEFRPAKLIGYGADGAMIARCLHGTGSHRAAQLVQAEALVLIPAETETLPAGAVVEVILL